MQMRYANGRAVFPATAVPRDLITESKTSGGGQSRTLHHCALVSSMILRNINQNKERYTELESSLVGRNRLAKASFAKSRHFQRDLNLKERVINLPYHYYTHLSALMIAEIIKTKLSQTLQEFDF